MLVDFYPPVDLRFQAIRLVECPEFRDLLLLLRPELKAHEIPRRTKLHEEVMKNWGKWFTGLMQDLQVRLTSCMAIVYANLAQGCLWAH